MRFAESPRMDVVKKEREKNQTAKSTIFAVFAFRWTEFSRANSKIHGGILDSKKKDKKPYTLFVFQNHGDR